MAGITGRGSTKMTHGIQSGDFSALAENYSKYRPDYSASVLGLLIKHVGAAVSGFAAADVGAGTGIWSRMLIDAGITCTCVEPNDQMREQGIAYTSGHGRVQWKAGSGEATGLAPASVDWVTMASSFHWVQADKGLREFARILRPGGHFTALWNPRNIEGHPLHEGIEQMIQERVPSLKRKSSGARGKVADMYRTMVSTGDFEDVIFVEAPHEIAMTQERYMGAWRSVNDIQAQAGPERFAEILAEIERRIAGMDRIVVPYLTRSWTAKVRK